MAADLPSSSTGDRERGRGLTAADVVQPVFVVEGGDVEVHASLDEAISSLEGIDVADGVYQVFDAAGRRIRLRAEGVKRGRFTVDVGKVYLDRIEESSDGPSELLGALRQYARRLGRTDLDSAALGDLIEAINRRRDSPKSKLT